jgi:hypothetical protein
MLIFLYSFIDAKELGRERNALKKALKIGKKRVQIKKKKKLPDYTQVSICSFLHLHDD